MGIIDSIRNLFGWKSPVKRADPIKEVTDFDETIDIIRDLNDNPIDEYFVDSQSDAVGIDLTTQSKDVGRWLKMSKLMGYKALRLKYSLDRTVIALLMYQEVAEFNYKKEINTFISESLKLVPPNDYILGLSTPRPVRKLKPECFIPTDVFSNAEKKLEKRVNELHLNWIEVTRQQNDCFLDLGSVRHDPELFENGRPTETLSERRLYAVKGRADSGFQDAARVVTAAFHYNLTDKATQDMMRASALTNFALHLYLFSRQYDVLTQSLTLFCYGATADRENVCTNLYKVLIRNNKILLRTLNSPGNEFENSENAFALLKKPRGKLFIDVTKTVADVLNDVSFNKDIYEISAPKWLTVINFKIYSAGVYFDLNWDVLKKYNDPSLQFVKKALAYYILPARRTLIAKSVDNDYWWNMRKWGPFFEKRDSFQLLWISISMSIWPIISYYAFYDTLDFFSENTVKRKLNRNRLIGMFLGEGGLKYVNYKTIYDFSDNNILINYYYEIDYYFYRVYLILTKTKFWNTLQAIQQSFNRLMPEADVIDLVKNITAANVPAFSFAAKVLFFIIQLAGPAILLRSAAWRRGEIGWIYYPEVINLSHIASYGDLNIEKYTWLRALNFLEDDVVPLPTITRMDVRNARYPKSPTDFFGFSFFDRPVTKAKFNLMVNWMKQPVHVTALHFLTQDITRLITVLNSSYSGRIEDETEEIILALDPKQKFKGNLPPIYGLLPTYNTLKQVYHIIQNVIAGLDGKERLYYLSKFREALKKLSAYWIRLMNNSIEFINDDVPISCRFLRVQVHFLMGITPTRSFRNSMTNDAYARLMEKSSMCRHLPPLSADIYTHSYHGLSIPMMVSEQLKSERLQFFALLTTSLSPEEREDFFDEMAEHDWVPRVLKMESAPYHILRWLKQVGFDIWEIKTKVVLNPKSSKQKAKLSGS